MAEANVPVPTSPFTFEFTAAATEHNTSILESFDYDLATDIDAYPGKTISPGSELRQPGQLEPLLRHHPTWQEFHVHEDMLYRIHSTPNRGRQAAPTRPANTKRRCPRRVSVQTAHGGSQTRPGQSAPTVRGGFLCNETESTPTPERQTERRDPLKPAT